MSHATPSAIRRHEQGFDVVVGRDAKVGQFGGGGSVPRVASDLDEGPVVEQDVERIGRQGAPSDLIRKGRDIGRSLLGRRVEGRVIVNGPKAVVSRE